jgi:chromosome segregation ATPase
MNEETIQETINSPEFEKEMLESRKKQHDKMVEDLMKQGFITVEQVQKYIENVEKIKNLDKEIQAQEKEIRAFESRVESLKKIFDPVKNKMDRYEAALLIIANKLHTCGTSMLWVEMQNVARYALTGEENDSNWSVSKLDMDAIDKAGKL